MRPTLTRIASGAVAGIAATATMTGVLASARWLVGEPPPRKLTRRVLGRLGIHLRRGAQLDAASALAHVAYGTGMGALYGMLPRRAGSLAGGALFGLGLWAVSYMGWIPKLGLMRHPSRDRPGRPTAMVLAHLVYGTTLAIAHRA
jgi:hypothetical protein